MNKGPKILLFDIETSPSLGYVWTLFETNVIKVKQPWSLLCFSYKWLGDKTTKVVSLPQFSTYKKNPRNDYEVTKKLHELFELADVIIGHNGDKFDIRKVNAKLIEHGFLPPSPYKTIDTLKIARKYFKFDSNRLNDLGELLGLGRKVETGGFTLWEKCINGDLKAWNKMEKYCITPDHKLLGKDLRWKMASEFNVGDIILGFDENGPRRRFKESIIESIEFDKQPVYKVTLESGKEFKVTKEHQWLVVNWVHDRVGTYKWKTTLELNKNKRIDGIPKFFNVWEEILEKDSGWLAGIYDGEGSLYNNKTKNINKDGDIISSGSASIAISQNKGIILDKIIKIIEKYKIPYKVNKDNNKCKTIRITGNLPDRLEFLGKIRPERLIKKVDFNNLGRLESRSFGIDLVKNIEYIGEETIIKIGTSTGTFICDGYPMHNCKQDVNLLEKIYLKFRPWIKNHPNIGIYIDNKSPVCTNCGSKNVESKGYGAYMKSVIAEKSNKDIFTSI